MAPTIAYDLPVKNLIDALSATKHVTHTKHRKRKVTLHHNGGRLSHEGVLDVWKVRPASAHFDIDVLGDTAQYVDIVEYAWATGTTEGNVESISIEMANLTLGPEWNVAEITWKRAARLTGWIHARVFGFRPTHDSVVVHSYWSATTCAGPYIDGVYDQILSIAQSSYDAFAAGGAPEGDDMTPDDMKYKVLASDDFRFDGRNPIDMWRQTVSTGFRVEAKLDALNDMLSDDEANIIAVFRQQDGGLPPEQQAELIKGQVNEAVWLAVKRLAAEDQS